MSINLDQLSGDQMLAAGAALQGNAKDYSNTQDVEGLSSSLYKSSSEENFD